MPPNPAPHTLPYIKPIIDEDDIINKNYSTELSQTLLHAMKMSPDKGDQSPDDQTIYNYLDIDSKRQRLQ
jgi:hypothetical protein